MRLGLTNNYYTWAEVPNTEKHSSLFPQQFKLDLKKF
jgi:hypothetical protein